MYKCPKCGQVFQGKARFCPNCGQPFVYPDQEETKTIHVVVHHAYDEKKSEPVKAKEEPHVEAPVEEEAAAPAEEVKVTASNDLRKKYIASAVWGIIANLLGIACTVVAVLLVTILPVHNQGGIWSVGVNDQTTVLNHLLATINGFTGSSADIISLFVQGVPLLLAAIGVIFGIVDLIILIVYAARSYETVGRLATPEALAGRRGHGVNAHVFPAWAFIFIGAFLYNLLAVMVALIYTEGTYCVVDFKWDNMLMTYVAIGLTVLQLIFAIVSACLLRSVRKGIRESIAR